MKKVLLLVFGLVICCSHLKGQTYCFTAPQGYGAGVTGGGNATPVTVTTQSELKSALTASGNGVILVSGTISCTYMSVLVTNKTLIGLPGARLRNLDQTQSGSGIFNLKSGSKNVIIRNLIFEGPGAYDTDGRDLLTMDGATKVWVDHCEFQDGVDGNFDNKGLTDNVTVSWCKFTYLKSPKPGGSGGTDDHRFSNLVGSSDSDKPSDGQYSITWQYCWWAQGCVERMTRARNAQLNMVNCYWNSSVAKVALGLGGVTDCYVENSVFANSGDKYRYYNNGMVRLTTVGCTNPPSNVGTCPAPSYTIEKIPASSVVNAVTGSCGAGATLNVTTAGVVSANSSCGGTTVNQSPVVSITSPGSNATFTSPASVTITANATDADGSVSKVDFYNGNTLIGTDATSPYSFSWTNVAAGTYTLTAKATDNDGAVATSTAITIVVNAPNQAPVVSITSPANNATLTSPANVTITANATDTDGSVSKVEFYNGNTLIGTDGTSPYSFSWTNVAAGTYTLTAKATDNDGAVTTSTAITIVVNAPNQAPVVSITAPANNATFTSPASVTITANATDADGSVSKVDFYNGNILVGTDATSPYSFSWTNVAAGTYTLTAKATDDDGAVTTSAAITIVVNAPNQAPVVSISSPANNATFTSPASVTITANATDADGSVSKVDFYNGNILIGTDPTSPYSFGWTNVAAGTYTLTAKATDDDGAVTTSAAITIVVNAPNQAPVVSITSPANNGTFTSPATVSITANATDADGSVSKVDFYNGNILVGTDATSPYSFSWTNVAAGTYTLTAKATDNDGAVTTSTTITIVVNAPNQAPVVSITSPANNATFTSPASVTITANATDADGSVSKVDFYNGNTLIGTDATSPYSFSWTNVAAGTYTLTAKATDNDGAVTTSTAITIVVNAPNQAPGVSITSPANNGTFTAPAIITIDVDAADEDGNITKVDFYNGTTLLGSDATAPYSFTWSDVAEGSYTLTAIATDNNGSTATSDPLTVSVNVLSAILPGSGYGIFTNVYPNPSSDVFTVKCSQDMVSVYLLDMYGEKVEELDNINGQKLEIGSSLPGGMYVLVVEYASQKKEIVKLVKAR